MEKIQSFAGIGSSGIKVSEWWNKVIPPKKVFYGGMLGKFWDPTPWEWGSDPVSWRGPPQTGWHQ